MGKENNEKKIKKLDKLYVGLRVKPDVLSVSRSAEYYSPIGSGAKTPYKFSYKTTNELIFLKRREKGKENRDLFIDPTDNNFYYAIDRQKILISDKYNAVAYVTPVEKIDILQPIMEKIPDLNHASDFINEDEILNIQIMDKMDAPLKPTRIRVDNREKPKKFR